MKNKKILILIFFINFIINFFILLQFKQSSIFNYIDKVTDSYQYYKVGQEICAGEIIGNNTYHQTPFYYYFLGILMKAGFNSLFLIRLIQIILGSLNAVILFLIIKKIFDLKSAITSSILFFCSALPIFYNLIILRTFLTSFFMNLIILFSLYLTEKNKALKLKSFFIGLLIAIGILTRPNLIILFSILFFIHKNNKKYIKFIFIGFGIILSLLVIRNYIADAPLLSISTKGPYEFASGNVNNSSGLGWAELSNANKIYREKKTILNIAINIIQTQLIKNPTAFLKLYLNKFMGILNNYEYPNNYNFYLYKTRYIPSLKYLPVNWGILFILFIVFHYFFFKEKLYENKKILYLYVIIFLYTITIIGFYVISRFKFPLFVLLYILSGFTLLKIFQSFKSKNIKDICIIIILSLISIYITYYYSPYGFNKKYMYALALANEANYYKVNKNIKKSIQTYKIAMNHYPALAGFKTLAKLYNKINDNANFEKTLLKGLQIYENNIDLTITLSSYYLKTKEYKKCIFYLNKISTNNKQRLYFKNFNLALCYYYLNNYPKSLKYWEIVLTFNPNDKKIQFNIKQLKTFLNKKKSTTN